MEHVREARKLVDAVARGSPDLGRPPADLVEVLAKRSVAGPATTALRALTRSCGPEAPAACAARDAAARIAWSFRTLFNLPEATALIRGERPGDETPYWRQVVDYCAAGNLQAVLDEYVHTLRDLEGLFAATEEEPGRGWPWRYRKRSRFRTGAPRADELRSADAAVWIERRRLRNHFAMRFGAQEGDDGKAGGAGRTGASGLQLALLALYSRIDVGWPGGAGLSRLLPFRHALEPASTPSTSSSGKAASTATRVTRCARTSPPSTGRRYSAGIAGTCGRPCSKQPGSNPQEGAGWSRTGSSHSRTERTSSDMSPLFR